MVLALADQDYQDIRYSFEEWTNKYKAMSPFGSCPWAEDGGFRIAQSVAVAAYFADKFSLMGKCSEDYCRILEVVGLTQDAHDVIIKWHFEKDEEKKAAMKKQMCEESLPRFFGHYCRLLRLNAPKGVFVGRELTLADLMVYDLIDRLETRGLYDCRKHDDIKQLTSRVEDTPRMKKYMGNRKKCEF